MLWYNIQLYFKDVTWFIIHGSSFQILLHHRELMIPNFGLMYGIFFFVIFMKNKLQSDFNVQRFYTSTICKLWTFFFFPLTIVNSRRLCNIIHQRQYNILLRLDVLFKFSSYAKQQQKFLDVIHGLTSRVIKKRKIEFEDDNKIDSTMMDLIMNDIKKDSQIRTNKAKPEQTLKYVRDDLDEIDENDVGECICLWIKCWRN